MKIRTFAILAAMLFFASCSSLQVISFDQLRPARISFPTQVGQVAVVNNMPSIHQPQDDILTLGDRQGDGKASAEALAETLADSKYFNQIIICDSALRSDEEAGVRLLAKDEVVKLSAGLGVDMLLSLDQVKIETRRVDMPAYGGVPVAFPVIRARISPVLSVYLPSRNAPLQVITPVDSIEWGMGEGVSDKQLVAHSARFAAQLLSDQLVPSWSPADRVYFGGGSPDMRDAAVSVREGNWTEAASCWEAVFNRTKSKKEQARAAINRALAAEMQGNFQEANQWMEKAKEKVKPGTEEENVWKFYSAQLEERTEEYTRLNVQMERFRNKF